MELTDEQLTAAARAMKVEAETFYAPADSYIRAEGRSRDPEWPIRVERLEDAADAADDVHPDGFDPSAFAAAEAEREAMDLEGYKILLRAALAAL